MRIVISTSEKDKAIGTLKQYYPIHSKGEVAHFLAEIESIKQDLLGLWESEEVQELKE